MEGHCDQEFYPTHAAHTFDLLSLVDPDRDVAKKARRKMLKILHSSDFTRVSTDTWPLDCVTTHTLPSTPCFLDGVLLTVGLWCLEGRLLHGERLVVVVTEEGCASSVFVYRWNDFLFLGGSCILWPATPCPALSWWKWRLWSYCREWSNGSVLETLHRGNTFVLRVAPVGFALQNAQRGEVTDVNCMSQPYERLTFVSCFFFFVFVPTVMCLA